MQIVAFAYGVSYVWAGCMLVSLAAMRNDSHGITQV